MEADSAAKAAAREAGERDTGAHLARAEGAREAYLLRVWRADAGDVVIRRVSLENVHTRERTYFADLEALMVYLRDNTCK